VPFTKLTRRTGATIEIFCADRVVAQSFGARAAGWYWRERGSPEIGTVSMARLLYAEFAPWAYATSLSHQRHLGRTVLPKG
jgi:hypothetical protein